MDFSIHDNLVLDPEDLSRIVSAPDWEMATVRHDGLRGSDAG
jgi:hypothetical protein